MNSTFEFIRVRQTSSSISEWIHTAPRRGRVGSRLIAAPERCSALRADRDREAKAGHGRKRDEPGCLLREDPGPSAVRDPAGCAGAASDRLRADSHPPIHAPFSCRAARGESEQRRPLPADACPPFQIRRSYTKTWGSGTLMRGGAPFGRRGRGLCPSADPADGCGYRSSMSLSSFWIAGSFMFSSVTTWAGIATVRGSTFSPFRSLSMA